jgi:hypothetical protein
MSFVVTVWAQPANTALPTHVMQASAQIEALRKASGAQTEPRFLALARALAERYPDDDDGEGDMYDHGLNLLESNPHNDQTYNIGIYTHNDEFDAGYQFLVSSAQRLGLHVMDEQNGLVHLAGGGMLWLREPPQPPQQPRPPAGSGGSGSFMDPLMLETIEQAKMAGIDPKWVVQAQQGKAAAQYNVGVMFQNASDSPTQAQINLTYIWLERAVAQHLKEAQRALGIMLLRGWGGRPIDPVRGMALLEQAAQANDVNALLYLSDVLYQKSTRTVPDGRLEKFPDAASVAARERVPRLLARAAAQGDMSAATWLATRLYDSVGCPEDDIGAKALIQLVQRRQPGLLEGVLPALKVLVPTKAQTQEVHALTDHFEHHLHELPQILEARWARMVQRQPAVAPQKQAAIAVQSDAAEDITEPAASRWHLGLWATLAAAIGFVLLMMFATSTSPGVFKGTAAVIGVVGAVGVWRTTADLDWGGFSRVLISAVALVPGAGFFACLWVLWKALRP